MAESVDLYRLRKEYDNRRRRLRDKDPYSLFNPASLFIYQQRQRAMLHLLLHQGFFPLQSHNILEVGCGAGGVLLELLGSGATPNRLFGIDLLVDRLMQAHNRLPHIQLVCADGQHLPYLTASINLVLQFTAFSSVLDDSVRMHMACEMLRVLKPEGMILWYDFWLNPTNLQTRGIRPSEVKQLFPNCEYHFERITLAPPIARRLVLISWGLCLFLESLKIFNTHYLVAIRPLNTAP